MNKRKHRSVYRTPPLVFYREVSHKYIFSYLRNAYSEDMGNTGCCCGEEPGDGDSNGRQLSCINPLEIFEF